MNHSESISKITPALLEAQKKITAASKDAENPYFKSKYADLPSVIDACKSALNESDIVALQPIQGDIVETVLIHSSGEWLSSETKIVCKAQSDPQAYGSAITYARRYGLQSFVLMPAEDDDGEGAMDRNKKPEKQIDVAELLKSGLTKIQNAKTVDEVINLEKNAKEWGKFSEAQLKQIHEVANSRVDKLQVKK